MIDLSSTRTPSETRNADAPGGGVGCQRPWPAPAATSTPTGLAVEVRGLRKSFGDHVVLDGIDVAVGTGTVFALLGPNGSGKTTTVRILSTLMQADAGVVRVAGHDVDVDPGSVRRAIGVTGQFSAVDNLLTGAENLLLMADLAHLSRTEGRRRADELLDRFDLRDAAMRMSATYSGGMRRRLDLAMTLMGRPRIIFLDEPTAGLDPRSRRTVWEIVRELTDGGVTIFLTTQDLEEADRLASRIAVLHHGRLVAEGTPTELKRLITGGHVELFFADPVDLAAAIRAVGAADADCDRDALSLRVPTDGSVMSLRALLGRLDDHSVPIVTLSARTADLDDVFLALTARAGADPDLRSDR
jgi:ABC-2 type transport system ATP-binding protein